jgi:HK97 family phage prohead protease
MLYKSLPQFTKTINGRTVTGIFAVHGNIDDGSDMSVNGAFAKRLHDGSRKRTRFLWNHDSWQPPIASIKEIREISREELPEQVLTYAPEATGGVEVTREYYENVELANWVLSCIKAGDIDEMSYGYNVHEFEWKEIDGRQVRILKDIELFDVSDVNFGMNPATAGVKGLLASNLPFAQHGEAVVSTLDAYVDRVKNRHEFRAKEGRVLSEANRKRIKALVASLDDVAGDLRDLLTATEPKADPQLVTRTYAEFQQILAKLNGAQI